MGRMIIPLVAKVGENVNVVVTNHIHRRPSVSSSSTLTTAPPHPPPGWHLPFWSGDHEFILVSSPPWLIALVMIGVGVTMVVFSCWKTVGRRRGGGVGEKGEKRETGMDAVV